MRELEATYAVSLLDHLVDTASDAAVSILESFNNMQEELKMLFNKRFPSGIRKFLWCIKLRNDVHHLQYEEIFASNHKSTVSVNDDFIGQARIFIDENN